jgi:thiol-disulfide isomerase/thioredoxin
MKHLTYLILLMGLFSLSSHAQGIKTWRVDESTIAVEADTFLYFTVDSIPLTIEAFNDSLATGKYIITSREVRSTLEDYLTYKHPTAETLLGQLLPRKTFTALNGKQIDINAANFTVISSWNKYCGICIAELTVLDLLAEDFPGVQFVALTGDPENEVQTFLGNACWKWRDISVVIDTGRSLMHSFHIITDPSNLIVDGKGIIRAVVFGGNIRELVTTLDRLCLKSSGRNQ